jgi:hypothetical protein
MRSRFRYHVLLLLLAAEAMLAIAAAACGGGSKSNPSPVASSTTAATTESRSLADAATALCTAKRAAREEATVASADLIEISGVVASRRDGSVLFAHNDSGDSARFFAIGRSGEDIATYTVTGADAVDWEDIAEGPGPEPGRSYIYLADIGDNRAQRPDITLYRVSEPDIPPKRGATIAITDVERITLRYPDRPHDAETLLVDPVSGEIVILTKEIGGPAMSFHIDAPQRTDGTLTLRAAGQIDFAELDANLAVPADAPPLPRTLGSLPTGGDVSATGDVIAVRTYAWIWVWARDSGTSLADALALPPACVAPSALEPQGEALAIDTDGRGYTTASEGAHVPLHHYRAE